MAQYSQWSERPGGVALEFSAYAPPPPESAPAMLDLAYGAATPAQAPATLDDDEAAAEIAAARDFARQMSDASALAEVRGLASVARPVVAAASPPLTL
jgi:hypothetical protein